jgi:hypothetical protein
MNSYKATFLSDHGYADKTFEAASPEEALKLALQYESETYVCVERFDGPAPIHEILIDDDEGECAHWQSDDFCLRLAAQDLLEAAELVVSRWEQGDLAAAVRQLAAAIAKAKGGAA